MKKHQTAKHRKQQKKEKANRKAKQLAAQPTHPVIKDMEREVEAMEPLVEQMSPARRAFQDV